MATREIMVDVHTPDGSVSILGSMPEFNGLVDEAQPTFVVDFQAVRPTPSGKTIEIDIDLFDGEALSGEVYDALFCALKPLIVRGG